MIMVFNKVDVMSDPKICANLMERFYPAVFTSAIRGIGLENLKQEILELLKQKEIESELRIPIHDSKSISTVYQLSEVIDRHYEDGVAVLRFRATHKVIDQLQALLEYSKE